MSRRPRPIDDGLAELGLEIGQLVRYVGRSDRRFREGVVLRREKDGSVGLRDDRGRARAIPVDQIEVRVVGGPGAGSDEREELGFLEGPGEAGKRFQKHRPGQHRVPLRPGWDEGVRRLPSTKHGRHWRRAGHDLVA